MRKYFTLILFTLSTIFIYSQEGNKVVERDGKKYYEYIVEVGDGVWGISKKFEVSQTDIYKLNPSAEKGLSVGQVLLIPVKEVIAQTDTVSAGASSGLKHVVLKGQTLYSIARIYGLSVEQLLEMNSSLENNIKIGDELIVSKRTIHATEEGTKEDTKYFTVEHNVQRRETLYSISKKYGVQIHEILALNPKLENGLRRGDVIVVSNDPNMRVVEHTDVSKETETVVDSDFTPVVEPKAKVEEIIDETPKKAVCEMKVVNDTVEFVPSEDVINVAVLLPFMSNAKYVNSSARTYIEMYKGMLLSMNKMKSAGGKYNVYTYDTQKSVHVLDSLFQLEMLRNADVIIGPAYPEEVPMVLNFAKSRNIPCILPFANKVADEYRYDNLLQFNPSLSNIVDDLYKEMFTNNNVKYILARTERCTNKGAVFADLMKANFVSHNAPYTELVINHENVDTLVSLVGMDSVVVLFGNSDRNQMIPLLKKVKDLNLNRMSIFGFDNWKSDALSICPNTYYYSVFNTQVDVTEFEFEYLNWFGSRTKNMSRAFDIFGYDIFSLAMDIVTAPKSNFYTNDISSELYLYTVPKLEYTNMKGYMNVRYYVYRCYGLEEQLVR